MGRPVTDCMLILTPHPNPALGVSQVKALTRAQPQLQGDLEAAARELSNATAANERETTALQSEKRALEDNLKDVASWNKIVQSLVMF